MNFIFLIIEYIQRLVILRHLVLVSLSYLNITKLSHTSSVGCKFFPVSIMVWTPVLLFPLTVKEWILIYFLKSSRPLSLRSEFVFWELLNIHVELNATMHFVNVTLFWHQFLRTIEIKCRLMTFLVVLTLAYIAESTNTTSNCSQSFQFPKLLLTNLGRVGSHFSNKIEILGMALQWWSRKVWGTILWPQIAY